MDIYERIKSDHDEAREMIEKIRDTTNRAAKTRRALFDQFKLDLWVHHKLEEAVLYALLKEHPDTRDLSLEALNEHHIGNAGLEELDSMPVDNPEWAAKFGALSEAVEHHMDEEEEEFFVKARKVIDKQMATELGQRFDDRKKVVIAALTPVDPAKVG
ncbi:MAG: hemerythrin domain-containing protein [Alphaproteobacteria bacterium]